MNIYLKPIGFVKNGIKEKYSNWKNAVSQIILDKSLTQALDGLQDFSHIQVIFYLNKVNNFKLKLVPMDKVNLLPKVGLFATRTQYRPNPIASTIVKLQKIEKNVITVKGLDAYDNTPVLDIKPFFGDKPKKNIKTPDWTKKL